MIPFRPTLRAALLALPLALATYAAPVDAQQQGRFPRRLLFAGLGVLVAGAAVSAYLAADEGRNGTGACSSKGCVATVTLGTGTLVGYMIGREFDELHAIRYRSGRPMELPAVTVPVDRDALGLSVQDSLVAVSGASGVQLFTSTARGVRLLGQRGSGVRGIVALDLVPSNGALAVGSSAGFYVYPPVRGPGLLLSEGNTTAIVAADDRVHFAVGSRIEVAPSGADTTRRWPGVEIGASARALHWDRARRLLWAATDSALVLIRPDGDSLVVAGRTAVDAPVRALDGEGTLLVGAMGERGMRLWDVTDPASPALRQRWMTPRFVYDAAIVTAARILVAAGTEGMYVVDASRPELSVLGLARELGFVTTVELAGQHAYLLDRYSDQLKRIDAAFPQ